MEHRQWRVLFFVFDGTGLGHLRRIARLAAAVQGPCAALVVTGMRDVAWILSPNCEFVHLPSWDSLSERRSSLWGRDVWLRVSRDRAWQMRVDSIASIFDWFAPDAVVVDYLAFGRYKELSRTLESTAARKYFLLRGIIDTSDLDHLSGGASEQIADAYDSIVVAADRRIVDVASEYGYCARAANLLNYIGYVVPGIVDRLVVRRMHGLRESTQWVVCAAGGGMQAEDFLTSCVNLAAAFPEVRFGIAFGPLSSEGREKVCAIPANCRMHRKWEALPEAYSACDVAVCGGGYNSLLEAASGGARIIVKPARDGDDDEQIENAVRLSRFYPVRTVQNSVDLPAVLAEELNIAYGARPRLPLDTQGSVRFRDLLLSDFEKIE